MLSPTSPSAKPKPRSFTSDVSQLEPPPVRTVVSQTTPWLMFAALAHYQGNDEAARHFLLNAGQGRQPGTNALRPSSCAETDDLEHLGDRGLLLTFLRQSVEQLRVLDGD